MATSRVLSMLRKALLALVLVGPLAVIGGRWFATSVDAYDVAERIIASDPAIESALPGTKEYRLAWFNGFRYSGSGTSVRAEYRFVLSTDARRGTLDLLIQRQVGRWRLVEGSLRVDDGGSAVPLVPREVD